MSKNLESDSDDDQSRSDGDSSSDSDNSDSDSSSSSNSNGGSDSNSDSKSDGSNKKSNSSGSSSASEAELSNAEPNHETSKNLSHSSSSSSNGMDNKKYWEMDPNMYGIRRSARERKQPNRITEQADKIKRKGVDQWNSSDESRSDDGSDSEPYSYQQKVRKKVPPQRKTTASQYNDYEDSSTIRTTRTGGKVSYKEDSDSPSDSGNEEKILSHEVVGDDSATQIIEKVIRHRMGKKGAVGQETYIYEVEKNGDPNSNFDSKDSSQVELHFLIKWKGWAHIHNTWESYESLRTQEVKGMKKLDNYMQRDEKLCISRLRCTKEDLEYTNIQNEMEQQLIASHLDAERVFAEAAENDINYYYVKWQNLPYAEATWESEKIVEERFPKEFSSFIRRKESPCYPKSVSVLRHRPKFHALQLQPDYIGMDDSFVLRNYQLDGLNWLIHAWCNHNSVILADEMGLGKTIQAISFLSYLFHAHDLYGPFLLVLPLSTINAWLKEFAQWAPDMNVIVYIGDKDSRRNIHEYEWKTSSGQIKFNAVLTTFEILLRDKDQLHALCDWSCLIVDEAHRLKNEESQLYQALIGFRTNFRLLITGTPLQNSLKELWALLHFIMPATFNDCEYFESHKDESCMKNGIQLLHEELRPYILRRVKKQVEKSLPAKVEQILRVDMTQSQKRYYRYILTRNYDKLKKGNLGSVSTFINIVMELKKCCNHATLIRQEEDLQPHLNDDLSKLLRGSGKLLLLDKLLVRLHETGHRVLIFSQMVMMLDILAKYMRLKRFPYQRLDGSISGELRKQALEHFNADGSTDFCFLLSTRAGGLGINLATADTVIIFDSDWNPQNDLQAQARAHRIGQKNQVNIYRLVTKNSIEETIIERAKKKMVLDHLVIQSMDTSGRTVFNKKRTGNKSSTPFNGEELNAILKFGAEELFKEDVENEEEPVCDIDEILQRAETRNDEGPSSAADDLLSAFKVASFNLEEEPPRFDPHTGDVKEWDDIIPEGIRTKAADEEKEREMAKLYLPPRNRNAANKNERITAREKNRRRRGSDFSDSDGEKPRRRGRPRMHHKETVKGFTDLEVRKFFKSFKKFSNPLRRLDTIANDASLRDKNMEDLKRLGHIIIERCKESMLDHEHNKASGQNSEAANGGTRQKRDCGPSFKLSGVAINARKTLATLEELEPLDHVVPHAPVERASWVLQLKRVKDAHWDIPWGLTEDSRLLRGIYEFGMGSWEQLKNDPSLNLADKILLGNEVKPQGKHLENRVQYLLKLIKKSAPISIIKKPIRSRGRKGKEPKNISKEIIENDSSDDEATNHSAVSAYKSSPKNEYTKHEVSSYKIKAKEETELDDRKKVHRVKHRKSRREEKSVEKSVPVTVNGEPTVADSELEFNEKHPHWTQCKKKMTPIKKILTMLYELQKESPEVQIKKVRKFLLEIGNHIEKQLEMYTDHDSHSQWKLLLWRFVSQFSEFDAKTLHKTYKKYKKEREEKHASHKDRKDKSKSENTTDHKKEKRKLEDESSHHSSKRPRNGWSNERHGREKDSHSDDKSKNKGWERDGHSEEKNRNRHRPNEESYTHNYDLHPSGSRGDYSKESRYPQDFRRDGAGSSNYHRESNYYNTGEVNYSNQGYYRGKSDWRVQKSNQQNYPQSNSYSQPHYTGGGYNQPSSSRPHHQQRPYNNTQYGSSQRPTDWSQKKDGRGRPQSFQT